MQKKQFANTEHQISWLGFGCWGIGKSMWVGAEDNESKKALRRAFDEGVSFFDTALVYGDGHSEKLLGEVDKETGRAMFIASKIPSKKFEWPAFPASTFDESFPHSYIIEQTEKSLRNLNRDCIDLMQFHVWNDSWAQRDEWKEAVLKLKQQGKVRYFGISINDHQPTNGIEAGKTGLIDCFQVIFNIFDQSPADELFPFCVENKIAVLARVPFDEGGLTGSVNPDTVFPEGDWRNHYFRGERKKEIWNRLQAMMEDAGSEVESPAELALRYTISFDAVTSVIPGMRSEKNLLANKASVEKGPLSGDLLEALKKHRWDRNFYK